MVISFATFLQFDLGYFYEDACRVEPLDNPFKEKVLPMYKLLPMSPERTGKGGVPERIRTSDPKIRNLVLYPAELRAPACFIQL